MNPIDVGTDRDELLRATPRSCPCCGNQGGRIAHTSERAAEGLSPDALVAQWAGDAPRPRAFFTYITCSTCWLVYCPAYSEDKALACLYSSMPANMSDVPEASRVETPRGYFDTLKKYSDLRGRYLEIGPDAGFLVQQCTASNGFDDMVLFEPNVAMHGRLEAATQRVPRRLFSSLFDPSVGGGHPAKLRTYAAAAERTLAS